MGRRTVLAVAGWLTAAAAAIVTGLAAVQLIGDGITTGTGGEVLNPGQAAGQLASAARASGPPTATPPTQPATPPTQRATAPATGDAKPLSGPGGTVVAVCDGGAATLLSWTPAQGFTVARADRGPDEHADVRFEGSGRRVDVRVTCADGHPVASWKTHD